MCFIDDDPPPIVSPEAAKHDVCDYHWTCQNKKTKTTRELRDALNAMNLFQLCDSEGKRQERRSRTPQFDCPTHGRLCWHEKIEADSMGAWVLFSCGFAGKMFDEGERGREKQVKHLKTPRRGRIRHQVHERVLVDCKHVDTTVLDFAPLDVNLLLNCKLLLSTEMQNHL